MSEKGDEFKGGAFMTGFGDLHGLGGSGEYLALLLLVLQDREATMTVLAVSAVMAVSVMIATPLKLNTPLFRHPEHS